MLLVKTELRPSKISGIGLHAAEFIPKGTVIWKFISPVDVALDSMEYEGLRKKYDIESLDRYIYRSKVSNKYILCGDDGRFINHSFDPNTADTSEDDEGLTVASRDILPGDEITSDYSSFDADYESYKHTLI